MYIYIYINSVCICEDAYTLNTYLMATMIPSTWMQQKSHGNPTEIKEDLPSGKRQQQTMERSTIFTGKVSMALFHSEL